MKKILSLPVTYVLLLASLSLPNGLLSQPTSIDANRPVGTPGVISATNVSGTTKANGDVGQSSRVLTTNSSSNLAWNDITGFENMITFTTVGSSTWSIPAGVTKLSVEAWGGGGGATGFGGGGGGGYVKAIFNVTPGGTLNCTIGGGGAGNAATATNGGTTNVSFSSTTIVSANGGSGNVYTTYGSAAMGGGFSGAGTGYYGIPGEAGGSNKFESLALNTMTYRESQTGGTGGDGGNSPNSGGKSSYQLREGVVNGKVLYTLYGSDGKMPGGGAGGNLTWGGVVRNGGQGMIIVRY